MALLEGMTDSDFDTYVLNADTPVLVAFVADWALPTHQTLSALEWMADDKTLDHVRIYLYDVDASPTPDEWKLTVVPTLALYANGKEIGRLTGQTPLPRIKEWLLTLTR